MQSNDALVSKGMITDSAKGGPGIARDWRGACDHLHRGQLRE
jgi:hypothetical protein